MACKANLDQELSVDVDIPMTESKEKRSFGQFLRKYFLEGLLKNVSIKIKFPF